MRIPQLLHRSPGLLLALTLAGAFTLRLALAPLPGLDFDIGVNQGWARSAAELGLARSYREQVNSNMLPNYPPFSMMIFALTGHAYRTLASPTYDTTLRAHRIAIKFPAIVADVLLALLLAFLIGQWRGRMAGALAGLVVALHPAIIYESSVWGQTDSLHTLMLLGAAIALVGHRPTLGGAFFTLAFLTKAQSVALAPLFFAVYLLRPQTILRGALGGLAVLIVVLTPFAIGGALPDVWNVYTRSVGYYPVVSSSAYNLWWSLLADSAWGKSDTDLLFGLITYRTAGYVIVGSIVTTVLLVLRKRLRLREPLHQRIAILFSVASLFAFAFFLFLTEMHERYLFPYVALGLPVAFLSRRHAVVYGSVSLLFFLNLLGYLPWTPIERALHSEFPSLDVLFASAQVFLFILSMHLTLALRHGRVLQGVPKAVMQPGTWKKQWMIRWPRCLTI